MLLIAGGIPEADDEKVPVPVNAVLQYLFPSIKVGFLQKLPVVFAMKNKLTPNFAVGNVNRPIAAPSSNH